MTIEPVLRSQLSNAANAKPAITLYAIVQTNTTALRNFRRNSLVLPIRI